MAVLELIGDGVVRKVPHVTALERCGAGVPAEGDFDARRPDVDLDVPGVVLAADLEEAPP